jgi:putative tricarboxylic transport membrane protein
MESFSLLADGIVNAMAWHLLLATLLGVVIGLIVGVLPGLGPSAGVAIMLPVAVGFDGTAAIACLGGIYYGAMFGGSVTSILLGIPGDAPAVMTVIDGHALAKKGEAGRALGMSVCASFVGGVVGILLLASLSSTIASVALEFGPSEMTALMLFALSLVSVLSGRNMFKGFAALFIGAWVGMIGLDPIGGPPRYTFGLMELFEGIDFTIVAVGLFGLSEMFISLAGKTTGETISYTFKSLMPSWKDIWACKWIFAFGSLVGFFVGVLPGVGATAATMLCYALTKKMSRHPERFGQGEVRGVAAPESANNSASYASMIPLFSLGIPGSATTAVLLGGLLMVGLQPGPLLFANNPDFVWTVFGTFWTGNLMLVFLTIALIPVLASIIFLPKSLLYPVVIGIVVFGVYSINYLATDVVIALIAGVIGYVLIKLDYPPVPLILGLVLGPLLEKGIRRALIISQGDVSTFFNRPISLSLMILTGLVIFLPLLISKAKKIIKKDSRSNPAI